MSLKPAWTKSSPYRRRDIPVVNIHAAKTNFSSLVDQAAAGEEIIIAKAGKPVARLMPLEKPAGGIRFGLLEGRAVVPDNFDDPLPDWLLDAFEGKDTFEGECAHPR